MTQSQTLHDYLSNLDSDNDLYGLFVNRYNLDEYAIAHFALDTLTDGKILVGRLSDLSCGTVWNSDDIETDDLREIQVMQADIVYREIQDYLKKDGEYDKLSAETLLCSWC